MQSYRAPKILFLPATFIRDSPGEDVIMIPSTFTNSVSSEIVIDDGGFGGREDDDESGSDDDLPNIFGSMSKYNDTGLTVQLDEIPKFFVDSNSWISGTNLLCWSCSNSFDGRPWFVPIAWTKRMVPKTAKADYEEENAPIVLVERKVMEVYGNFCGPACTVRYINDFNDEKIINIDQIMRLFKVLYKMMTGCDATDITKAEKHTRMQQYCGPGGCTVGEYRQMNNHRPNGKK